MVKVERFSIKTRARAFAGNMVVIPLEMPAQGAGVVLNPGCMLNVTPTSWHRMSWDGLEIGGPGNEMRRIMCPSIYGFRCYISGCGLLEWLAGETKPVKAELVFTALSEEAGTSARIITRAVLHRLNITPGE